MKLQVYVYQCENCKSEFKVVELLGEPYGEFLLRSTTGKIAYLNAIDDMAFKTLSKILTSNSYTSKMKDIYRATILHAIFGITCDLASDGSEYKIGGDPVCPNCGSHRMTSWKPIYPPEIIEQDISYVTHDRWNKLSDAEKKSQVNDALEKFFT